MEVSVCFSSNTFMHFWWTELQFYTIMYKYWYITKWSRSQWSSSHSDDKSQDSFEVRRQLLLLQFLLDGGQDVGGQDLHEGLAGQLPHEGVLHSYVGTVRYLELSRLWHVLSASWDSCHSCRVCLRPMCCAVLHRFHNRFLQSWRRPLLGPSSGWKRLLALSL